MVKRVQNASAGGYGQGARTPGGFRAEAFHWRILSKSGFWGRIQESDSWIGLRDRIQGSNSRVGFMDRAHEVGFRDRIPMSRIQGLDSDESDSDESDSEIGFR